MAESASAGTLFGVLWDAIGDVMGNAATATLLRRAARRAAAKDTSRLELGELVIVREGLEYQFRMPPSWSDARRQHAAICALIVELQPLLIELTGHVVLRKLAEDPRLRECGLSHLEEDV